VVDMRWSGEANNDDIERPVEGRRSRLRVLAIAPVVAVLAVGLMMVLTPLAAASSAAPAATTTLKAPYSGESAGDVNWANTGCGNKYSLPAFPDFNLTKGVFTGTEISTAKSCGSANSTLFGEIQGSYATYEWTAAAGTYSVSANWAVADTVTLSAVTGGSHPGAGSYAVVGVYAEIVDTTNGTTLNIGSNSTTYVSSAGTTTSHNSYKVPLTAQLTLVAGHKYILVTGIYVEVNAFVLVGSNSASSEVKLSGSGNKATLSSVVLP
jgi:hypothetical protein